MQATHHTYIQNRSLPSFTGITLKKPSDSSAKPFEIGNQKFWATGEDILTLQAIKRDLKKDLANGNSQAYLNERLALGTLLKKAEPTIPLINFNKIVTSPLKRLPQLKLPKSAYKTKNA